MHLGLSGINVAWLQSNEACYGEFIILPEAGLAFSQHRLDNITIINMTQLTLLKRIEMEQTYPNSH